MSNLNYKYIFIKSQVTSDYLYNCTILFYKLIYLAQLLSMFEPGLSLNESARCSNELKK